MPSTYELVIDDDNGMTTVVPLLRDEVSIGRKPGNAILLTERNVSRRHARLLRMGDEVRIEDLDSYTGVRVNGQRIHGRAAVQEGDQVQIGDYQLALRRVAVIEPPPRSAAPTQLSVPVVRVQDSRIPAAAPPRLVTPDARPDARPEAPKELAPARPFTLWRVGAIAALFTIALLSAVGYERKAPAPAAQPKIASAASTRPQAMRPLAPAGPPAAPSTMDSPRPAVPAADSPAPVVHRAPRPARHSERVHQLEASADSPAPPHPADEPVPSAEQAAALLETAQAHYIHGEFQEAIRVARALKSSQGASMTRAWRILGAAACKLNDLGLIGEAYKRLDVPSRQYMLYVCQQAGVTLSSGRFLLAH